MSKQARVMKTSKVIPSDRESATVRVAGSLAKTRGRRETQRLAAASPGRWQPCTVAAVSEMGLPVSSTLLDEVDTALAPVLRWLDEVVAAKAATEEA